MSQMGFFDVENRYAALDAKNDPLVKINAVVPWEAFRSRLENVWRKPADKRKSNSGCKPWGHRGVDPISWTPDPLGRRYPRCRERDRRIRRPSGVR